MILAGPIQVRHAELATLILLFSLASTGLTLSKPVRLSSSTSAIALELYADFSRARQAVSGQIKAVFYAELAYKVFSMDTDNPTEYNAIILDKKGGQDGASTRTKRNILRRRGV